MPFDTIYLVYGAIFICAVLVAEGIFLLVVDNREHSKANRRMNMLASGMDGLDVFNALRRRPVRQIRFLGPLSGPVVGLEESMMRAGLRMSLTRIFLIMGALAVASFLALFFALQRSALPVALSTNLACAILALLIGVGVPLIVVGEMKSRRMKAFGEQLPDTLDTLVRSLRAGHPIASAMTLVTQEMPDPVGTEFGIAVDEMTYGLELRQSLDNMGARIQHADFEYVIVAINIQHETGGNLAEVLSNLATIIRARFRMFKKIKALSSEGRMSAWVLCLLPVLTLLGLSTSAPRYYAAVMNDPLFLPIAGTATALMILGIYIMYRMVNFRV